MGDKTLKNWDKDLRGLTDDGVRERLAMARAFEAKSMARGMGRNPKAARMWREKIALSQAELERRGVTDD